MRFGWASALASNTSAKVDGSHDRCALAAKLPTSFSKAESVISETPRILSAGPHLGRRLPLAPATFRSLVLSGRVFVSQSQRRLGSVTIVPGYSKNAHRLYTGFSAHERALMFGVWCSYNASTTFLTRLLSSSRRMGNRKASRRI